jgi:hypothetical protein
MLVQYSLNANVRSGSRVDGALARILALRGFRSRRLR